MDRCLDVEIVGTCCMYSIAIWNNMMILYNHSKLDVNEIMSRYCLDISRLLVVNYWIGTCPIPLINIMIIYIARKKRSIFRHCFMELHVSILNTLKQVILQ